MDGKFNRSSKEKITKADQDLTGLGKACLVRLAIKYFPFAEQFVLLAMLPVVTETRPCASTPILGIPPLALHRACGVLCVLRICKWDGT